MKYILFLLIFFNLQLFSQHKHDANDSLDAALEDLQKEVEHNEKHNHDHFHDHHSVQRKNVANEGFLESLNSSWHLFRYAYLSGLALAVVLSLAGVILVLRRQAMTGPAVSQAGVLGIAVVLFMEQSFALANIHSFAIIFAVIFSVVAMLLSSNLTNRNIDRPDAKIAIIFFASMGLSILIMSNNPHGMQTIEKLINSSLLTANLQDLIIFSILCIIALGAMYKLSRHLTLLLLDPQFLVSRGHNIKRWNISIDLFIGISLGLAIHSTGMIYASTLLIFPALTSRLLVTGNRKIYLITVIIAIISSIIAFLVSTQYDFLSVGPLLLLINLIVYCLAYAKRLITP